MYRGRAPRPSAVRPRDASSLACESDEMQALRLAALSIVLLVMFARDARADSGDGAGVGPVIGMTWNGSFSLGWEVGGSLSNPLLRLAAGGSYHLTRAEDDPRYFHYLAWE